MALPTVYREQLNIIVDGLTTLCNELIDAVQGTEQTGKIQLTNGSNVVTGTDTTFTALTTDMYLSHKADRTGYQDIRKIDAIIDDFNLTLNGNWNGDTKLTQYVAFTKDEYLKALEYPTVIDLRIFDSAREWETNTPSAEFWAYAEEITDAANNAIGTIGLTIISHRANFRLMQLETLEIMHDISRWIHVQKSHKMLFDHIQYGSFEAPIAVPNNQRDIYLATTFYFFVQYLRKGI